DPQRVLVPRDLGLDRLGELEHHQNLLGASAAVTPPPVRVSESRAPRDVVLRRRRDREDDTMPLPSSHGDSSAAAPPSLSTSPPAPAAPPPAPPPAPGQAGLLAQVLDNVRASEELYRNIEVISRASYKLVDAAGNAPTQALTSAERRYRAVTQNNLF